MVRSTAVPAPDLLQMLTRAPICWARSCTPIKPQRPGRPFCAQARTTTHRPRQAAILHRQCTPGAQVARGPSVGNRDRKSFQAFHFLVGSRRIRRRIPAMDGDPSQQLTQPATQNPQFRGRLALDRRTSGPGLRMTDAYFLHFADQRCSVPLMRTPDAKSAIELNSIVRVPATRAKPAKTQHRLRRRSGCSLRRSKFCGFAADVDWAFPRTTCPACIPTEQNAIHCDVARPGLGVRT